MNIYWKNNRTRELFEDKDALRGAGLDKKEVRAVVEAMSHIISVNSINQLPHNMNCHPIKKGNKFECFGIDIPSVGGRRGKNRILLKPVGDDYDLAHLKTITKVEILGIGNYHKG